MHYLLIQSIEKPKRSTPGHVRLTMLVKELLEAFGHECTLWWRDYRIDLDRINRDIATDFDAILMFGGNRFPNHPTQIEAITGMDAELYWFTNDHNCVPCGALAKMLKERESTCVATFSKYVCPRKYLDHHRMINLNALFFKQWSDSEKTAEWLYYGSYRSGRKSYFKQYLNDPVIISTTSAQARRKFRLAGATGKFTMPLHWDNPSLRKFAYSIYLEDADQHLKHHFLGSRFYESLSVGAVVIFDSFCLGRFEDSPYKNYEDFLIDQPIPKKFPFDKYDKLREIQLDWVPLAMMEKGKAIVELKELLEGRKDGVQPMSTTA